uniref:Uncharacterized protein n=1 Tax=Panagrolaimus sp. ES5 TaxID=591445 RepID=A0AC34G3H8_9BILA
MSLKVSIETFTTSNELSMFGFCLLYGACSTLMIWILSIFEFHTHFFDGNPFRSEKRLLSFELIDLSNFAKESTSKNEINNIYGGGIIIKESNEMKIAAAGPPTTTTAPASTNQTFTSADTITKPSDRQIWSGSIN